MRPFCVATIGVILGIIIGLYLKSIAFFIFTILILLSVALKVKNKLSSYIIIIGTCFIVFCIYTLMMENNYAKITQKYDKQSITIQGIIVSNGNEKKYKIYKIFL